MPPRHRRTPSGLIRICRRKPIVALVCFGLVLSLWAFAYHTAWQTNRAVAESVLRADAAVNRVKGAVGSLTDRRVESSNQLPDRQPLKPAANKAKTSRGDAQSASPGAGANAGLSTAHNSTQPATSTGNKTNKAAKAPGAGAAAGPDVTLVSQTNHERVWMLEHVCTRWPGPLAVAILGDLPNLDLAAACPNMRLLALEPTETERTPEGYPVNRLRNLAINAVNTSHFLVADIDMWPDSNLYASLRELAAGPDGVQFANSKAAFVVPVFKVSKRFCKTEQECIVEGARVPKSKEELKACMDDKGCSIFDVKDNHEGQSTTDYKHWWAAGGKLKRIGCFKSDRYEPYLVAPKGKTTPLFGEQFTGYGKNKIQWVAHLRYLDFKFYVVPEGFLIHAPHPKSKSKKVWEDEGPQGVVRKNDARYSRFLSALAHLQPKGPAAMVTPLCRHVKRAQIKAPAGRVQHPLKDTQKRSN